MKSIIYILFLVVFGACESSLKDERERLSEASGLIIPPKITDIKTHYIKDDDYVYPYSFYSKFKCDRTSYNLIESQVSEHLDTAKINGNFFLDKKILRSNSQFLWGYGKIDWWDIERKLNLGRIIVNYFDDNGNKTIGDSTNFNGKIVLFFDNQYCYLYIQCFPKKH